MNKELVLYTGSTQLQVTDNENNASFPVLVHYPTWQPSVPTAFGPYVMDVSPDAALYDGNFPLVIMSHGNGGSHLLYRTISTFLAKHGYIVAMPEHYGNNRNNNTLENTIENLKLRPLHISLTIDALLKNEFLGERILANRIAVVGHSMGGYTALALAGGVPYTKEAERVSVEADCRVKAIVLMAPGTGWFRNNLSRVTIPVLMLTAEHDPVTPDWNAEIVLQGVSDAAKVTFRKVPNAGHFSFLSPFPDHMKKPGFMPATDPEGFDREIFHQHLPAEILDFLSKNLF